MRYTVRMESIAESCSGVRSSAFAVAITAASSSGLRSLADLITRVAESARLSLGARYSTHEEHVSMTEWIGGPFDPSAFEINDVNERLAEIKT